MNQITSDEFSQIAKILKQEIEEEIFNYGLEKGLTSLSTEINDIIDDVWLGKLMCWVYGGENDEKRELSWLESIDLQKLGFGCYPIRREI